MTKKQKQQQTNQPNENKILNQSKTEPLKQNRKQNY